MPEQKDDSAHDMVEGQELPEPFIKALNEIVDNKIAVEPLKKVEKRRQKPLPQILDEIEDNIRAAFQAAIKAEEAAKAAKEAAIAATKASLEGGRRAEEAREAGQMAAEIATKAAADAARKAEETARAGRLAAEAAAKKAEAADISAKAAVEAMRKAAVNAAKKAADAANATRAAAEESVAAIADEASQAKKTIKELKHYNSSLMKRIKSLEERVQVIETALPVEKAIILRAISKEEAEKEICNLFAKGDPLYYSDIAEHLNLDLELVVNVCNELQKRGEIKVHDDALQSR